MTEENIGLAQVKFDHHVSKFENIPQNLDGAYSSCPFESELEKSNIQPLNELQDIQPHTNF